ncbi:MAG TPA: hypothetical protein VLB79_12840 [Solirubrobacterales bacterium]|nr:hypothetical protein [Solirubrobacterales bacterium]
MLREDPEPDRLFDPEALPRPERFDPALERELRELELRCCCSCSPGSPSPSLRSFFATVTAAGTAIPTAAPASAFFPVDIPA